MKREVKVEKNATLAICALCEKIYRAGSDDSGLCPDCDETVSRSWDEG